MCSSDLVMGGVMGAALYTQGLKYYVADNMARYGSAIDKVAFSRAPFDLGHYMEGFVSQMMEVSIKQVYGWTLYACILLLLLFLLYDAPVRRDLKAMPSWRGLRKEAAEELSHRSKK